MRAGLIAIAASALAGPAIGQAALPVSSGVIEISGCEIDTRDFSERVTCDATNVSDTAVARIRYAIRISQEDRAVPWYERGVEGDRLQVGRFAGGVEPGETLEISFRPPNLYMPDRADLDRLVIDVVAVEALDVNDQPVATPET